MTFALKTRLLFSAGTGRKSLSASLPPHASGQIPLISLRPPDFARELTNNVSAQTPRNACWVGESSGAPVRSSYGSAERPGQNLVTKGSK